LNLPLTFRAELPFARKVAQNLDFSGKALPLGVAQQIKLATRYKQAGFLQIQNIVGPS
jgi:hypothetical protein